MDINSLTRQYSTMSLMERTRTLAQLSWHLTVLARGFYPSVDPAGAPGLVSINEFQHRITQMIIGNTDGTSHRTDQELIEYLFEGLQELGATPLLEEILK